MKKITLSALALLVVALSFNVAAQDNAEKVKERIMPLINGKVSVPDQEELFNSLVFAEGKLVSYKYSELRANLTQDEYDNATLVMNNTKSAIIVENGQTRSIGVQIPENTNLPGTVIFVDKAIHYKQRANCYQKYEYLCVKTVVLIKE